MASAEGEPPQQIGAEQSVLGGMLLSAAALAGVVEVLRAEDFYRPAHQTIYRCVLDLYGRGEPADPITVSAELERRGELARVGGAPYLHTLIESVPTAANAAYYAEIVADKATRRRLVEVGTRLTQVACDPGRDAVEALDAARTALADVPSSTGPRGRYLVPVSAASIKPRRVRWLWERRIVLGGLTLLAGREGLGKSTVAVDIAARATLGQLDGELHGQARTILYISSEDSREFTVVPRLIAAGANLDKVLFVDAHTETTTEGPVVLPLDLDALAALIAERDAALVVLDAATSVMDGRLDGDRDRQMRQALEPVSAMADRTGAAVLGIVHFGKRDSADTGKLILGSIAWSQVARSVIAVAKDDDTGNLVISTTKANLAPGDTPSLSAAIRSATVETPEGNTVVGRVEWLGETQNDARDLLGGGATDDDERADRNTAIEWLRAYLTASPSAKSAEVKEAAKVAGFSDRTLRGARTKLKVQVQDGGFPRTTYWSLPTDDDHTGDGGGDSRDGVRARVGVTTDTTGAGQRKQEPSRDSHDSGDSRDAHVPTDTTDDPEGSNPDPPGLHLLPVPIDDGREAS